MDLWIRTQDCENTVKVINGYGLKYNDKKTIIANYQPDFTDNYDGYYEVLGAYKTKERALEVLDEIQNILFPKFKVDTSSIKEDGRSWVENGVIMQKYTADINYIKLDTYVYEMPND